MGGGYRIVEHTADLGIKAWGSTPKELLEEAAQGMMNQVVDPACVEAKETREVGLEADTLDELLIQWLREILYIFEKEKLLSIQFQIEKHNFNEKNPKHFFMQASIKGDRFNSIRHDICKEIKAVTRHGLYVKRNGPWWEANILFDV